MNETEKPKMLTQSSVMAMDFTKSMIEKLLPPPTLKTNPRYKCAAPMKLWDEAAVVAAMETDEFMRLREAGDRRKSSAKKAVVTKKAKAEMELDAILSAITVKRVDMAQLQSETLAAKQAWYEANSRWEDEYLRDAYTADDATAERWMVNYVRHNLCIYDDVLYSIYGKAGKDELYTRLKEATLQKIAQTYPELSKECNRQLCEGIAVAAGIPTELRNLW